MKDLDEMIFDLVANGDYETWQYGRITENHGIIIFREYPGHDELVCWLSCNDGIVSKSAPTTMDGYLHIDEIRPSIRFDICSPQFDPAGLVKFIQDATWKDNR